MHHPADLYVVRLEFLHVRASSCGCERFAVGGVASCGEVPQRLYAEEMMRSGYYGRSLWQQRKLQIEIGELPIYWLLERDCLNKVSMTWDRPISRAGSLTWCERRLMNWVHADATDERRHVASEQKQSEQG